MKRTIFLAAVVITASAQEQYPQCLIPDCGDYLTIGYNCGYDGITLTSAQTTCVCNAAGVLTAYQKCAVCLKLDPNSTTTYDAWPTDCTLNTAALSTSTILPATTLVTIVAGATSTGTTSVGVTAISVEFTSTTLATASISPSATGGSMGGTLTTQASSSNAQASNPTATAAATSSGILGLGYCGDSSCSPGDTSADTYKDSRDGVVNSGGVKVELYRCFVFGLVVGALGWL